MLDTLSTIAFSLRPKWFLGNSTRSKQNSLLRILSISHSQRLSPVTLIENLAVEYPGSYGRKLRSFSRWIAADSSIGAALAHTPGVLDEDDALAIQCGIETGTLPETFDFLLKRCDRDDGSQAGDIFKSTLGYVLAVLFFAILVTTFLMVFIIPTFEQIFEEFSMALPDSLQALIDFSNSFALIVPLFILTVIGLGILMLFEDVRRSIRRSPLGRLVPGTKARRSAGLLRLLALPTCLEQPVGPTLTAAAQYHPDRRFRQQLLAIRTQARSDGEVWSELSRYGIINKIQGEQMLNITSPSIRGWSLETLAEKKRRLAESRTGSMARALQHVPIVILGGFVGWIVFAVMQTLTNLIQSLA